MKSKTRTTNKRNKNYSKKHKKIISILTIPIKIIITFEILSFPRTYKTSKMHKRCKKPLKINPNYSTLKCFKTNKNHKKL